MPWSASINSFLRGKFFKKVIFSLSRLLVAVCIFLGIGFYSNAQAQSVQVQGRVTRASNKKSLPAVNVVIKGTTSGTTTDKNGHYSLTVPSAQDTLVFSYIGFKRKMVPVKGRSVINVFMKTTTVSQKQLVVIGYGQQQEQNVNGSVSTVSTQDIKDIPEVSTTQLLQGQASGVTVTHNSGAPGAASSVHIRGITSINGNNQPLYIIDGVPVSGDANNSATSGQQADMITNLIGQGSGTLSPLSQLNPNDIKSISILKDASAEAIYGSRGANGVVIIKTKSGQSGHSQISYNGYVGEQAPVKKLNVMNLRQYARLQNDLGNILGQTVPVRYSRPSILGNGTNWQNALYRHAALQSHHLAFSGGNDKVTYYISGGYTNKDGIEIGSNYERYTIQTHIDAQVTDWLTAGIRANGSLSNTDAPLEGAYNGATNIGLLQAPDVPVYNADGTFAGPSQAANGVTEGRINPIGRALSYTNTVQRNKLLGNLYAKVDILPGLSFKSSFSGNFQLNKNNQFKPTYQFGSIKNTQATAYQKRATNDYWDWKNYFTYKHTFPAENQITWLLGQEAQKTTWEGIIDKGIGFKTNNIQTLNQAQPTGANINGYKGEYTMSSYYTRLIYSFEHKYGLTASVRADGSSKFAQGHRWGYFPAVAGHWDIYKEPFMNGITNVLNKLTLKAGYGVTGNQDVGNFLYTSTLRTLATGFGTAFGRNNISNPNLTWEHQKQLNIGLTFGFLNNRLNANVEVYNKISDNFLFQLPLPTYLTGGPGYQGGVAPPTVNLGKVRNRGIDVTLQFQTQQSKDFQWQAKATISHYKNKVETLNNQLNITESIDNGYTSDIITKTVKGGPVGRFYGYKVKGLFRDSTTIRNQPKQFGTGFAPPSVSMDSTWLGDVQYKDINGDGVINAKDKTFIGNPNPLFTYGFNNRFNYKNVSLRIFIQGSYGNDIYNFTRRKLMALNALYTNQLAAAADYYTSNNQNATVPRPKPNQDNNNLKVSNRFVENGSYMRIKNVQLGYTIPKRLTQQIYISRLHVYGSIQNLYTLTAYSGYSPDIGTKDQNALRSGIDNGRYPDARIFSLGLNIDF